MRIARAEVREEQRVAGSSRTLGRSCGRPRASGRGPWATLFIDAYSRLAWAGRYPARLEGEQDTGWPAVAVMLGVG